MNVVFVTGNAEKARYFSELAGHEVRHQKVDVAEIQSLDAVEVVTAKALAAYELLQCPVIIEDTSLIFHSMGLLPGTFIKWFMEQLGPEGLCKLANTNQDCTATATAIFAYYNGTSLHLFKGGMKGTIAATPHGSSGFGWNAIFKPEGQSKTLGEMDDVEFKKYYVLIKPFGAVKQFLDNLQP